MAIKRIAFTITDSGMDGMSKTHVMQAFWNEKERDVVLSKDKNKAWRSTGEMIVEPDQARRQALAKLNGIDKLALGL